MELLLLMVLAHFLGDFYIQRNQWVSCRNQNHFFSMGLAKHIVSHVLLLLIVLWIEDKFSGRGLIVVTLIALSHLFIDLWKSYKPDHIYYFLLDQVFHLLIIVFAWMVLSSLSLEQIKSHIALALNVKYIAILGAYIIACKPASITIGIALQHLTLQLGDKQSGLASAGRWIGYFERCLIISFILIGQFAGVGFLLAVKTIFRFGDLTKEQDMKLTEYMMLGTLVSFSCALLLGWAVQKMVL